jgi:excinuclease ABC subunit C
MVDGGPEQLKFALDAIKSAPLKPKFLISLAKKPDRIFLPERKLPLRIPRGNKGLSLLSRVRDEVHRFGITFQRNRQRKKSLGF